MILNGQVGNTENNYPPKVHGYCPHTVTVGGIVVRIPWALDRTITRLIDMAAACCHGFGEGGGGYRST